MSEIILKIDYREHKLIDNVSRYLDKKKDKYDYLTFEKCNLNIGDIIIEYKDIKKELVSYFIIERKTITDMISSIKDGRYKEQKSRICAHVDNLNKKDKLCHFFYLLWKDLKKDIEINHLMKKCYLVLGLVCNLGII